MSTSKWFFVCVRVTIECTGFNCIRPFIHSNSSYGIRDFCQDMGHEGIDALNSFARWKNHVYGHDLECFDYSYETLIQRNGDTSPDAPAAISGRRQFYYLQCTQLGMFSVTDETTWLPNVLSAEFHLNRCQQLFGDNYQPIALQPALRSLTVEFGALDQRITNILYTNGAIDPWLHSGMLYTRDQNATALLIEGYSKSADLGSLSSYDSTSLNAAKLAIQEQIMRWSIYHD